MGLSRQALSVHAGDRRWPPVVGGDDDDMDIPAAPRRRVDSKQGAEPRSARKLFPELAITQPAHGAGTLPRRQDGLPFFGEHRSTAAVCSLRWLRAYGISLQYDWGGRLLRANIEGASPAGITVRHFSRIG